MRPVRGHSTIYKDVHVAIDLPPDPPAVEVQHVIAAQQASRAIALETEGQTYQIFGASLLDIDALKRAIAGAPSSQNAANAIREAYIDAGYLLVVVHFLDTRSGGNLYVYEGRLTETDIPEPLQGYFARFVDQPAVKEQAFRRRAILADAHADLAGYDTIALYDRGKDPGTVRMDVKVRELEPERKTYSLGVSNGGNRFVGEYFASAQARHATVNGRQYRGSLETAFSGNGASADDGDLYTVALGVDQITPLSTFDINVSHTDYEYSVDPSFENGGDLFEPEGSQEQIRFDGATSVVAINAAQIAVAWSRTRLSLIESLQYIADAVDRQGNGATVLDEQYATVGLRAKLAHQFRGDRGIQLTVTPGFKQSFAESIEPNGSVFNEADDQFRTASLDTRLSGQLADSLSFFVDTSYQWAFDALPQYEEWVLGGAGRMAAWSPGILVGDQGSYVIAAIDRDAFAVAGMQVNARLFAEYGGAEFEQRADTPNRGVADAGIRLSTQLLDNRLSLQLTSAAVIDDDDVPAERSERLRTPVFVSLAWKF